MNDDTPRFTKRTFPVCAEFVEAAREAFGDDVRVVCVEENGQRIGEPPREARK